jgi:hypothetical protein
MSDTKAGIKQVKEFFETDGRPLTNTELLDFKKTDSAGYDEVAEGIGNGSFTY